VVALINNLELEASIVVDLEDRARWAVYADWLQAQGDPRGEMLAFALAQKGETDPARFLEKRRRMEEAFTRVAPTLLGEAFALREQVLGVWRGPFLESVRLDWSTALERAGKSVEWLAQAVLDAPASRLLKSFSLPHLHAQDPGDFTPVLQALHHRGPASLRALILGGPMTQPGARHRFGDLQALPRAFPHLTWLELTDGLATLGLLEFPKLTHLSLRRMPQEQVLRVLKGSPLPLLQAVTVTGTDWAPTLEALGHQGRPQLRKLMLQADDVDGVLDWLSRASLLRQLEELELHGPYTEAGVERLLAVRGALKRLQRVTLAGGRTTSEFRRLARKLLPGLELRSRGG
jgi:uncharacterized protein (TIGR02996 family)